MADVESRGRAWWTWRRAVYLPLCAAAFGTGLWSVVDNGASLDAIASMICGVAAAVVVLLVGGRRA